jgi:teichuronic acid biosynthesis glycosyltransferase TuaC
MPGGPHVLIVPSWYPSPDLPLSGIFFKEQALALRAAGMEVGVVYPELRSLRTFGPRALRTQRFQVSAGEEDGLPTLRVHGWHLLPRLVLGGDVWAALASALARRYVARFGVPSVVHAHGALWAGHAARRVSRELGVPFVVTEHFSGYTEHFTGFAPGKMSAGQLEAARTVYRAADRVVAVSTALKEVLVGRGLAPASRTVVVPNLVDTEYFSLPPEGRREAPEPFRLLAVGSLERIKGVDLLIRAYASAFGTDAGVVLEIGGAGPGEADLRRLAAELGIAERVRFLGPLARAEVREAMWRSNLFVSASRIETFGVALVEAMATGLPVVTTASGGPEDIVASPETGWIVPADDLRALTAALALARREGRARSALRVRGSALDRFSAAVVTTQLARLYQELASGQCVESRES